MSRQLTIIEDLAAGVEAAERASGFQFTDPQDIREAVEIISRIEQMMIERSAPNAVQSRNRG